MIILGEQLAVIGIGNLKMAQSCLELVNQHRIDHNQHFNRADGLDSPSAHHRPPVVEVQSVP